MMCDSASEAKIETVKIKSGRRRCVHTAISSKSLPASMTERLKRIAIRYLMVVGEPDFNKIRSPSGAKATNGAKPETKTLMKGSLATPTIYLDVDKTDFPVKRASSNRKALIGMIKSNCFFCGEDNDGQDEKSAGVAISKLTNSANPVMG